MAIHKAWKVAAVCCGLAGAAIGISINTSGVFYDPVSESLGVLRGDYAMHMTVFVIVTAFSALWGPALIEKFSFKKVLWISVLVAGLATVGMAYATQLWQFYLLAGLRGLSTGMFAIVPLTMLVSRWFNERTGLATSIVLGFSGIVGAIFPAILGSIIKDHGWQVGYLSKSAILVAMCLPALLYPFKLDPKEEGKTAFGSKEKDESVVPSEESPVPSVPKGAYLLMMVFGFFISFMTGLPQYFPGYAQASGMDPLFGASLLSAAMLGNVSFKLIIGALCDRIGALKSSLVLMGVVLIGLVTLMLPLKNGLWVAAAFCYGGTFGMGAVMLPLLTRQLYGPLAYASKFPKISFVAGLGAAIALSAIGYIYDFSKQYLVAFLLLLILLLSCFGLLYIVFRRREVRN